MYLCLLAPPGGLRTDPLCIKGVIMWVSHRDAGTHTLGIFCCLARFISKELGWKLSSQDSNLWHAGVASSSLTGCTMTRPSHGSLWQLSEMKPV